VFLEEQEGMSEIETGSKNNLTKMKFEFLMPVTGKRTKLWDVTPCSLVRYIYIYSFCGLVVTVPGC
jgi:hypothetical protein